MQSIVTPLQFSGRVRLRVDLTIVLLASPPFLSLSLSLSLCLSLTHHLGIGRPVVSHCVFAYCVGSSASRARLQWDWAFKKFHIEEATQLVQPLLCCNYAGAFSLSSLRLTGGKEMQGFPAT